VDERQADLYAAIDAAADRSARAVARAIGRRRAKRAQAAETRAAEKTGISKKRAVA
jgi:ribosome-associated translation inhibitor RaiA